MILWGRRVTGDLLRSIFDSQSAIWLIVGIRLKGQNAEWKSESSKLLISFDLGKMIILNSIERIMIMLDVV